MKWHILQVESDLTVNSWDLECCVQNTGAVLMGVGKIRYRDNTTLYAKDWATDGVGGDDFSAPDAEDATTTLKFDTVSSTGEIKVVVTNAPSGSKFVATVTAVRQYMTPPSGSSGSS